MGNSRLLSGLILCCILLGLMTQTPLLLGITIPLILYIAPGLLNRSIKVDLFVNRQLSCHRSIQDDEVDITLRIINNSPNRLEEIYIEDVLPGNMEILEGSLSLMTTLAAGESVPLNYKIRAHRGYYRFNQVNVQVNDHFGVIQKSLSLFAPEELLVLPNTQKLTKFPLRLSRPLLRPGSNLTRIGGPGTQFFEVREYQPGDSLRHINWHACARNPDSFFSNSFEQERVADVGLILDQRRISYPKHPYSKYFGQAVDATAILADTLLATGNRVGMLLYGSFVNWIVPGYGKFQKEKIFHVLSRAQEGSHQAFERMDNIPLKLFPQKSQIILISPLHREDIPALLRLRARRYELTVVMPNFTSVALTEQAHVTKKEMVQRVARIEQKLIVQKLENHGIFVLDWDVTQDFEQVVHTDMHRFRVWHHRQGAL